MLVLASGCAKDGVGGDGDGDGDGDAGSADGAQVSEACNMTGRWVGEQHVVSTALSADQRTTTWYYYEITQTGGTFTMTTVMNCGLVVDGTTTVTLGDDTLECLARNEAAGNGRQGTFVQNGDSCEFHLDRSYNLRGADKAQYLLNTWQVGDDPIALSDFPALPSEPPGMQDWDDDAMDGVTLSTGLGNRYVAQRDWNEHDGTVPTFASEFGGEGVIDVTWDAQEAVSLQTSSFLRTGATPVQGGWARYTRADDLVVVTTGDHPELDTCRNVQQYAAAKWP
ncbi:MAG TPA: hypothetical protein VL172_21075 [Kofleriaceae bacterium]|jgi:hypothetical protein|nr:hypothetical protein [Kofleriaceae bacterium]